MTFRYMLRNRLQNFSTKSSAILNANNIQVSLAKDVVQVNWQDGKSSKYHFCFLRSLCTCEKCRFSSGQRMASVSSLKDLRVEQAWGCEKQVHVQWSKEHISSFDKEYLRKHCYSASSLNAKRDVVKSLSPKDKMARIDYAALVQKSAKRKEYELKLLDTIVRDGVCIVENTPKTMDALKRMTDTITPLSHSYLYGEVFDVISKPKPENIAYSTEALDYHLDLSYYESPPGLQFLHCMEFDATIEGGHSSFVDVFLAANNLKERDPESFRALTEIPATFVKQHFDRANPAMMEYQRPHISVNHADEVISVFWSPPFEGVLSVPYDLVPKYYKAYQQFHNAINGLGGYPSIAVNHRLQEGEIIAFNQRRMLHARTAYKMTNGTTRHLRGGYLNIDEVYSKYRVLATQLKHEHCSAKLCNGDYRS